MYSVRKIKSRLAGTFLFVMFVIISCSSTTSPVTESEKEAFINTYVDLTLLQIKFSGGRKVYERTAEKVFIKYGTSVEFLEEFTQNISSNPKLQAEIYEEISLRLKAYNDLPLDSINQVIKFYLSSDKEK